MNLYRDFPYLVAGYLIAVGLFFILSDILGAAYLSAASPEKYYLYGVSVIFIVCGALSFYLKYQGKLKKSGKSVKEVRLDAIANLNDAGLLANIALEENDDDEIQSAAEERLKELSN